MTKKEFFETYQKAEVESYNEGNYQIPDEPLVTVKVSAYNHESFIEDCLNGILSQQLKGNFEILLNEDASTDQTLKVCKKIAEMHPDKIRLFIHSNKNKIYLDGKPKARFNSIFSYLHTRGKYLAICDGDDIWTDPYKLQKQVNTLERNPEYSFCFHGFTNIKDDKTYTSHYGARRDVSIYNVLWKMPNKSSTTMFRTALLPFSKGIVPDFFLKAKVGDYPMVILAALEGKGKFLKDRMTLYRVHAKGVFSSLGKINQLEQTLELTRLVLSDVKEIDWAGKAVLVIKINLFKVKILKQKLKRALTTKNS
jgi:glycosyltransferase involved in cell wall biosynthesis